MLADITRCFKTDKPRLKVILFKNITLHYARFRVTRLYITGLTTLSCVKSRDKCIGDTSTTQIKRKIFWFAYTRRTRRRHKLRFGYYNKFSFMYTRMNTWVKKKKKILINWFVYFSDLFWILSEMKNTLVFHSADGVCVFFFFFCSPRTIFRAAFEHEMRFNNDKLCLIYQYKYYWKLINYN